MLLKRATKRTSHKWSAKGVKHFCTTVFIICLPKSKGTELVLEVFEKFTYITKEPTFYSDYALLSLNVASQQFNEHFVVWYPIRIFTFVTDIQNQHKINN